MAGRHFILTCVDGASHANLSQEELDDLQWLAYRLAEQYANTPGAWQVAINGPAVAHRKNFHVHIKLPAGADQLERLTG